MKLNRRVLALPLSIAAIPVLAQTAAHRPAATHRATASTAAAACVKLPELSPKIPSLPSTVKPCAKALFTIDERLTYVSPLLGPEIRQSFSNLPQVITLAYIDTQIGTGEPARPRMYYTVHYSGYLVDGTEFDSTTKHPDSPDFTFPYGGHQVIPGWDMGFEGMRIGGKRRLFIPYQLAYGERGHPPAIPAKAMLVFDMELIKQTDPQTYMDQQKKEQKATPAEPTNPSTPPANSATTPNPATANPAANPTTDPTKPTTTPHE